MLFNSIDFAVFLPIVFFLYWFVFHKNLKIQNLLILVCSYIFYGWWDWRFLSLIAFSSFIDYFVGIGLSKTNHQRKRKSLLILSLIVNLGFLGFFKYFNFFADNFVSAFTIFGANFEVTRLKIILPVGISFYTFQTLSYSIDVYRKKLEPTKDIIAFFAFVSFFPQLVAGPIERATNLLSQFYKKRNFDYLQAVSGLKQILWGFVKKLVIADNCAKYANMVFNNQSEYNSSALILGAVFFSFQIYGDFAGYSDIAIGTAKLFGIKLRCNFANPYFSRDIAEFWRRWHISLSSWFRDYVYIPLGGSRVNTSKQIRNIFIIFLLSGFWHGANWTFIMWGAVNACLFIPLLLLKRNRSNLEIVAKNSHLPSLNEFIRIILTFGLVTFAWIFFRAQSISAASQYLSGIVLSFDFQYPNLPNQYIQVLVFVVGFVIIEWIGRKDQFAIETIVTKFPLVARWLFYIFVVLFIGMFMGTAETPFIYFQF
jgi:alginate O-acetyltransferase complex protein AlgI